MALSRTSRTRISKRQRLAKVARMHVDQHMTMRQIAEALGVGISTVKRDVDEVLDDLIRRSVTTVARGQAMESARLDSQARVLTPLMHGLLPTKRIRVPGPDGKDTVKEVPVDPADVAKVQLGAATGLRRISESRRRLLGWDSIEQVEVAAAGVFRYADVAQMPQDQLLARLERLRGLIADTPAVVNVSSAAPVVESAALAVVPAATATATVPTVTPTATLATSDLEALKREYLDVLKARNGGGNGSDGSKT